MNRPHQRSSIAKKRNKVGRNQATSLKQKTIKDIIQKIGNVTPNEIIQRQVKRKKNYAVKDKKKSNYLTTFKSFVKILKLEGHHFNVRCSCNYRKLFTYAEKVFQNLFYCQQYTSGLEIHLLSKTDARKSFIYI